MIRLGLALNFFEVNMENDPRWQKQMWVIPGETRLTRDDGRWFIDTLYGVIIVELTVVRGERLAAYVSAEQHYQSRRFRRSLRFRWERFWYLRRKRKIDALLRQ